MANKTKTEWSASCGASSSRVIAFGRSFYAIVRHSQSSSSSRLFESLDESINYCISKLPIQKHELIEANHAG